MAARILTNIPASWGPSVTVGVLAFTYHACSLPLKTLAFFGPYVSSGYLLVLDLECTIHTTCILLIRHFTHTGLNTYLWGRTYVAHYPHRCRCPIFEHRAQRSGPVECLSFNMKYYWNMTLIKSLNLYLVTTFLLSNKNRFVTYILWSLVLLETKLMTKISISKFGHLTNKI